MWWDFTTFFRGSVHPPLFHSVHPPERFGCPCRFTGINNRSSFSVMEAVPQEVRFTVEFVPGNRTYDVNRVLLHLGLGTLDCDVNHLIFLTSWAVGRGGVPNVSHLADFWTAWDELLDPSKQYHFYVTDSSLMHHLDQHATAADHSLLLCHDQTPPATRDKLPYCHPFRDSPGNYRSFICHFAACPRIGGSGCSPGSYHCCTTPIFGHLSFAAWYHRVPNLAIFILSLIVLCEPAGCQCGFTGSKKPVIIARNNLTCL